MQVHIQTLPPLDHGNGLAAQVEALIRDLLGSESRQLLKLHVQVCDAQATQRVIVHLRCLLQAWRLDDTLWMLSHEAPTLVRALHGAIGELRQHLQPAAVAA